MSEPMPALEKLTVDLALARRRLDVLRRLVLREERHERHVDVLRVLDELSAEAALRCGAIARAWVHAGGELEPEPAGERCSKCGDTFPIHSDGTRICPKAAVTVTGTLTNLTDQPNRVRFGPGEQPPDGL